MIECCNSLVSVFYSLSSSIVEIDSVGTELMLLLFKSKMPILSKLRYKIFMEKVNGKKAVKPENLPLTEDSARQHFLRVYHQIQIWLGYTLDPLLYGWRVYGNMLVPLFMTQPAASENLLTYIHCGCKEDKCKKINAPALNMVSPVLYPAQDVMV